MNKTVTVELTGRELFDLTSAISDYETKWLNLYMDAQAGKMPQNFSVEGAGFVYTDLVELNKRLRSILQTVQ